VIMKMLFEREDANLERVDTDCGRTPQSLAAENRNEEPEAVQMLSQPEDVNPDYLDTFHGGTPLSSAAENRHKR